MSNNPQHRIETPIRLADRRLVRVAGPDAESFLQNVMTNDIGRVAGAGMVYSCLLTPQGQFLHDFFVLRDPLNPENFIVDIAETLAGDFLKRLAVFRLRAKITLETVDDGGLHVYAHPAEGLADPRLPALGRRFYTPEEPAETAEDASVYHDLRIALGIPDGGRTAQQQKDFPADLNLDRLNAIAWDKGCFIGQEVAARMHHRGLAKKRLMILGGSGLAPGDPLTLDGRVMGEVRDVNTRQDQALGIVRLDALQNGAARLAGADGRDVAALLPLYIAKTYT